MTTTTRVQFEKGVEANLPTSGMAEDGHLYLSNDNGNMYLGMPNGSLLPLNRSPYYGQCSTASSTNSKVVTLDVDDDNFYLNSGVMISVKFTNDNTATSPTLNVNNTGAVAVKLYGTTAIGNTPNTSWHSGEVVSFIYDGSYWMRVGFNTTFSTVAISGSYSDLAHKPSINNVTIDSGNNDSAKFSLPIVTYKKNHSIPISPTVDTLIVYNSSTNTSSWELSGKCDLIPITEDLVGVEIIGKDSDLLLSEYAFLEAAQIPHGFIDPPKPEIIPAGEKIVVSVPYFRNGYIYIKRQSGSGRNPPDYTPQSITLIKLRTEYKADKVIGANNGNFAGLDSTGNLTDSGYSASDFLSSSTVIPTITFRQW